MMQLLITNKKSYSLPSLQVTGGKEPARWPLVMLLGMPQSWRSRRYRSQGDKPQIVVIWCSLSLNRNFYYIPYILRDNQALIFILLGLLLEFPAETLIVPFPPYFRAIYYIVYSRTTLSLICASHTLQPSGLVLECTEEQREKSAQSSFCEMLQIWF